MEHERGERSPARKQPQEHRGLYDEGARFAREDRQIRSRKRPCSSNPRQSQSESREQESLSRRHDEAQQTGECLQAECGRDQRRENLDHARSSPSEGGARRSERNPGGSCRRRERSDERASVCRIRTICSAAGSPAAAARSTASRVLAFGNPSALRSSQAEFDPGGALPVSGVANAAEAATAVVPALSADAERPGARLLQGPTGPVVDGPERAPKPPREGRGVSLPGGPPRPLPRDREDPSGPGRRATPDIANLPPRPIEARAAPAPDRIPAVEPLKSALVISGICART